MTLPAAGDLEIKRIGASMVIGRDDILIRSWSNENRIKKMELAGYRTTDVRGGVYVHLVYKDPQRQPEKFLVPTGKRTAAFREALAPLIDLDARDRQSALEAIRQSELWGRSPEERMQALENEKRLVTAANVVGGGVAAWALLFPHPRAWVMAACIAVVAALMLATAFKEGRWRLSSDKNDPRPSPALGLIACVIGLAVRAMFDVDTFDWRQSAAIAAIGGAIGGFALPLLFEEQRKLSAKIVGALASFAFSFGAINAADTLLDTAPAQVFKAELSDKYVTHGRSTSYTWVLGPWGPSAGGSESVDSALYDQVNVGDSVCVYFHPGALHLRWYTIDACGARKSAAP